jgi:uncharacterized damage-inducible protein DinB
MNVGLVDFYKHHLWANLGLLDACAHLTDKQLNASAPGTYGRIGDTLVHPVRAEESYLARFGLGHKSRDQIGKMTFRTSGASHASKSGKNRATQGK